MTATKHIPHIISSSAHTSTTRTLGLNDGRISLNKLIAAALGLIIIIILVIGGYSLYVTILGIVGGCLLFCLLSSEEYDIKSKADPSYSSSKLSSVHACRYILLQVHVYQNLVLSFSHNSAPFLHYIRSSHSYY